MRQRVSQKALNALDFAIRHAKMETWAGEKDVKIRTSPYRETWVVFPLQVLRQYLAGEIDAEQLKYHLGGMCEE